MHQHITNCWINTINFTPTSTNDIIFLMIQILYNIQILGFTQGTSSTLSSSDTKIAVTGQHSEYNTASALYSISNIQATVTGLSASTKIILICMALFTMEVELNLQNLIKSAT